MEAAFPHPTRLSFEFHRQVAPPPQMYGFEDVKSTYPPIQDLGVSNAFSSNKFEFMPRKYWVNYVSIPQPGRNRKFCSRKLNSQRGAGSYVSLWSKCGAAVGHGTGEEAVKNTALPEADVESGPLHEIALTKSICVRAKMPMVVVAIPYPKAHSPTNESRSDYSPSLYGWVMSMSYQPLWHIPIIPSNATHCYRCLFAFSHQACVRTGVFGKRKEGNPSPHRLS